MEEDVERSFSDIHSTILPQHGEKFHTSSASVDLFIVSSFSNFFTKRSQLLHLMHELTMKKIHEPKVFHWNLHRLLLKLHFFINITKIYAMKHFL